MDACRPLVCRRTVLRGLAVGGGMTTTGVLAACGGSSSSSSSSSDALGATTDVAVGSATIFADQKVVVSQPTEGDFKAFSAVCTHNGCIVSTIEGEDIVCGCHGSRYSIADGSVLNGPAEKPLAPKQVSIDNDEIVLS
ncbi:MAG: Rieske (2Fe-2S) protein [Actinomycetota bacterium]|nr:Rieske (2Fe-2S) protein [Actinomycetota bacterium]